MRSNQEYVERVRLAVESLHKCSAIHEATLFVHLESHWRGDVEVFELRGHPTATRCYAWFDLLSRAEGACIAMLHRSAITSAEAAVRASLAVESESRSAP